MNPALSFFDFALLGSLCARPTEPAAPARRPNPERPPREPAVRSLAPTPGRRSRRKAA